jgi:outer membrane protein assembly factor BamB
MYSKIIDGDLLDTYASKPYMFKPDMALLDGETGQRKWTWNNVLRDTEPVSLDRNTVIPYENQLFYNYGPRNYCVDLKTGQTIWRKDRGYTTYNGIARELGPLYFVKGTPNAVFKQVGIEDRVYLGNVRTGEEIEVATPPYNRDKWKTNTNWRELIGFVSDLHPVLVGADTLLITIYNEPSITRHQYEAYIGLYNLTKREWVYDRKRLNPQWPEAFNSSWLTVVGDKMFTILNNAVACSNWRTGELIWFKPLPSFAAIPTPIENKYLAVFSTDSKLYLLDINTGETVWWKDREIMAVTSQMYYDQGILYYLTKTLNAVEISSGKKLWSMLAPTTNKLDGNFWGFITGTPGTGRQKGRIFTRTGYHTYCFEAIK